MLSILQAEELANETVDEKIHHTGLTFLPSGQKQSMTFFAFRLLFLLPILLFQVL